MVRRAARAAPVPGVMLASWSGELSIRLLSGPVLANLETSYKELWS